MKRRAFLAALGGAAVWPLVARAQQQAIPVIGFLHVASPGPFAHLLAEFQRGLGESGYVVGQNVAMEFRWAEGQYDRLPALAADLVGRQVTVIVTGGGEAAARAAKTSTATIPVVFNTGSDPVTAGLVASLGRPAGNATGVNLFTTELAAKRLGLLHDLIPAGALVTVLVNPNFPAAEANARELEEAARGVGRSIRVVRASSETEIDSAFDAIVQMRAGAILVGVDPFFNSRRDQIVALAARHAIPAIYEQREFAMAGGLMSYGTSLAEAYRQQGMYAGRILKGEKPSDLPVMQLSKFELVINLKTAKALGLTVPTPMQLLADEVIE